MSAIVFGSINMDLVIRSARLPVPGETQIGYSFSMFSGGKGANQAVALARLGIPTYMIGNVGDDDFGKILLENLNSYGVNTSEISIKAESSSGVASITVDDVAENCIIVVHGANAMMSDREIRRLEQLLPEASVVLFQLEIPMDTTFKAIRLCHERGVTVVLDPAPTYPLPKDVYPLVDIITPNQIEIADLTGAPVTDEASANHAANMLLKRGVKNVIIKMGDKGIFFADKDQCQLIPAIKVSAIDTVAAGDAFNGALSAALSLGYTMPIALRWGITAGAISVTRQGAQNSMPTREELLKLV